MKSILFYGRPNPTPDKYVELVKAAQTVRRVAVYKTLAIQKLGEALDNLEGK